MTREQSDGTTGESRSDSDGPADGTRREFLTTAGAGVGALAFGPSAVGARTENSGPSGVRTPQLEDDDSPTLSVELSPRSVYSGEYLVATLTLSEAPDGVSGFAVTVEVDDPSVAAIDDAEYADAFGLSEPPEYADDDSAVRLKAVDLNDEVRAGDEDVELATVELVAEETGETPIGVAVDALDSDDDGEDVDPAVAGGTLRVRRHIPGSPVPQDIDGDGVHEDINANDELDADDVVLLFEYIDEPEIQDHPDAFDVNGSGELDLDDVVSLFEEL